MGHRASVAYLREDGTVQAHYSHWGALDLRLAFGGTPISRDRPFGSDDPTPEFAEALFDALAAGAEGSEMIVASGDSDAEDVSTKPYWEGEALSAWAAQDGINYLHHEAAYVVDTRQDEWTVRAFDTVWWDSPDRTPGRGGDHGTLVECVHPDEWDDYSALPYGDDWADCSTFAAFVDQLRETLANPGRIPAFAPGGTEGDDG